MTNSPLYVADTHSLIWYFSTPTRLGRNARAAFDAASTGQAKIIIPIIVIAESVFIIERGRAQVNLDAILDAISHNPGYEIRQLGLNQMMCLRRQTGISSMHDRLIACEAVMNSARLITNDQEIIEAGNIDIAW